MTKHNLKHCKICGEYIGDERQNEMVICQKCSNERNNQSRYQRGERQKLGTNPNCASYLGVYISEQILFKIYKNVQRMPMNNPGYDFICGKGYKVDVKSGCLGKNRSNKWEFKINKNKTADYFLCLAFDNRQDLNPLYVWLIPGKDINHLNGAVISKSTLDRWSEYEQSIDKVISCCNMIRK